MGVSPGPTINWEAFAAIPDATSGSYEDVKAAILVRYDINDETYRQ